MICWMFDGQALPRSCQPWILGVLRYLVQPGPPEIDSRANQTQSAPLEDGGRIVAGIPKLLLEGVS